MISVDNQFSLVITNIKEFVLVNRRDFNSQAADAVVEMFFFLCSSVRKQITSIINCLPISIIKTFIG